MNWLEQADVSPQLQGFTKGNAFGLSLLGIECYLATSLYLTRSTTLKMYILECMKLSASDILNTCDLVAAKGSNPFFKCSVLKCKCYELNLTYRLPGSRFISFMSAASTLPGAIRASSCFPPPPSHPLRTNQQHWLSLCSPL